MRNPGYYWVKFRGNWLIAEWHKFGGSVSALFFLPLISWGHDEKSMDEIDERKIERDIELADKHKCVNHEFLKCRCPEGNNKCEKL